MEKRTCLIEASEIARAAELIRAGELVAFPTETVYGLGANALDAAAVEKIYVAKGRPAGSPLIVHVDSVQMARSLVREWPETANLLARKFWPGPLTLVLPKAPQIPGRVTGGLDTVGIRMPAHPIALNLIQAAGVPIAAPSANRFTELSPTTADHVRGSLGDRVSMVLDEGRTQLGIESTVISLADGEPTLLRPGMISRAQIEAVIGSIRVNGERAGAAHPSPGMHRKHYSSKTPLFLVKDARVPAHGRGAYLWITQPGQAAQSIQMPTDPHSYGTILYEILHEVDAQNWDWIAVETPPSDGYWAAIADRLQRAAER
jgi:L-threonylcarbamoyladenylate synthase